MKKFILIFLLPVASYAVTVDCSNVYAVKVPNAKGILENFGDIRDVVKNCADIKDDVLAAAKTAVESKITAASGKTTELAPIKAEIDMVEAAGGTIDSAKKTLVTNSVTIENQKKADKEDQGK